MGCEKENSQKMLNENGDFQVVLFERYEQVLCCVKIQEKIYKYVFDTIIIIEFFPSFHVRR